MSTEPVRNPPVPDEDSAPYWAGLARHEIVVQQCGNCGTYRCPPLPACPVCGSLDARWDTTPGLGTIYSWIEAKHAVGTLVAADLPVVFATVEIEHGCRLIARYLGPERPRIDAAVAPVFIDHDTWTELAFQTKGIDR